MKSVFVSLMLVLGASFSAQATAIVIQPAYVLAEAKVHPQHSIGGAVAVDGYIQIYSDSILMSVQMAMDCSSDFACPAVMPNPIELNLPITSVQATGCGDVYEAEYVDQDNVAHSLRVVDYSTIFCRIHVKNVIHVTYTTQRTNAIELESPVSYFEFAHSRPTLY